MPQQAMANVGLNFGWDLGQDGWKAGMDNNLILLDVLVQGNVADKDLNAPPGGAALGDRYIVGSAPTGAWAGKANQVAVYDGAAWRFAVPREGWQLWVQDEDRAYYYTGSAWRVLIVREHVQTKTTLTISGGTVALDTAIGGAFTLSMTANVATLTISNVPANDVTTLRIRIQQDATGGRTFAWPASFKWVGAAPAISSAANAVDLLELVSFDGGTTWLAELKKGWA